MEFKSFISIKRALPPSSAMREQGRCSMFKRAIFAPENLQNCLAADSARLRGDYTALMHCHHLTTGSGGRVGVWLAEDATSETERRWEERPAVCTSINFYEALIIEMLKLILDWEVAQRNRNCQIQKLRSNEEIYLDENIILYLFHVWIGKTPESRLFPINCYLQLATAGRSISARSASAWKRTETTSTRS